MCCITVLLSRTALRMLERLYGFQMVAVRFLLFFFRSFFFFLIYFLGGSCASSKCCSCCRRYSTCPSARSSIWDGESLLLLCSPSPSQPLLTRCWFAAPSRCRGAHDAPAAGDVRAAHDEAPVWSHRWPWCTGEYCCTNV